jgi:pyrroline-5-carboxylate reductase
MHRLALVGGGKMGEALLGGLLSTGWTTADAVTVVERLDSRRAQLAARFPGVAVTAELPPAQTDVVLAVKPADVTDACSRLGALEPPRVLSIAAGVTTARLEALLPPGTRVLRAMPNTPALVGAGAAAIAPGANAGADDVTWATSILSAVGTVAVIDEGLLDAVTGLSGSGPAYVFLLAEALIEAGVGVGLPLEVADALTRSTLLGAARLLVETGEDPAVLRANVTSPGGTTAAGLAVFEAAGFRELVQQVVAAATARSAELGS